MGKSPRLKWDVSAFSGDAWCCGVVRLDVDFGKITWMLSRLCSIGEKWLTLHNRGQGGWRDSIARVVGCQWVLVKANNIVMKRLERRKKRGIVLDKDSIFNIQTRWASKSGSIGGGLCVSHERGKPWHIYTCVYLLCIYGSCSAHLIPACNFPSMHATFFECACNFLWVCMQLFLSVHTTFFECAHNFLWVCTQLSTASIIPCNSFWTTL